MRLRIGVSRPLRLFAMGLLAALAVSPAAAEFMPRAEKIALPSETPVLSETLLKLLYAPRSGNAGSLRTLDDALIQLSQPTPLRGFIQFVRATGLIEAKKEAQAREAIEESIRLLPDHSGPLLVATGIYAYSNQPARATDYLLRASRIDPQFVALLPEYEVDNLMRRLTFAQDDRRIRILSERLLEIGWKAESLDSQSNLVVRAIEARMAATEIGGAAAFVPKLLSPADSRALLVQNRYRALWPDVERWAGPRLETQWKTYLAETRSRWEASKSSNNARAYLKALNGAGHDQSIIRIFLPLFSKSLDSYRDQDLIYVVPPLAGALARKGRWNDVDALYEQAMKVWPLGESANALNLTANRARHLFYRDRPADGLKLMDAALADAARWTDKINGDALAAMHYSRACMLHELGRHAEAGLAGQAASTQRHPVAQATLLLCFGRQDAARDILIGALEDEEMRDDVLIWAQPNDDQPMASAYGLASHARSQTLRTDPRLLAALAEHGRVLAFGLNGGAPPETPVGGAAQP